MQQNTGLKREMFGSRETIAEVQVMAVRTQGWQWRREQDSLQAVFLVWGRMAQAFQDSSSDLRYSSQPALGYENPGQHWLSLWSAFPLTEHIGHFSKSDVDRKTMMSLLLKHCPNILFPLIFSNTAKSSSQQLECLQRYAVLFSVELFLKIKEL